MEVGRLQEGVDMAAMEHTISFPLISEIPFHLLRIKLAPATQMA